LVANTRMFREVRRAASDEFLHTLEVFNVISIVVTVREVLNDRVGCGLFLAEYHPDVTDIYDGCERDVQQMQSWWGRIQRSRLLPPLVGRGQYRAVKTVCGAAAHKRRVTRNTPNAHFCENCFLVFFSYCF
jgi:hypothetical protein